MLNERIKTRAKMAAALDAVDDEVKVCLEETRQWTRRLMAKGDYLTSMAEGVIRDALTALIVDAVMKSPFAKGLMEEIARLAAEETSREMKRRGASDE